MFATLCNATKPYELKPDPSSQGEVHVLNYNLLLPPSLVISQLLAPPRQRGLYPFFSFSPRKLGDLLEHSAGVQFATLAGRRMNGLEEVGEEVEDGEEHDEDFILVDCMTNIGSNEENT